MQAWVEAEAARLARRIERELEALVAVSSPSGDSHGAEEAVSLCAALLPADAETERLPSSTKGYAPDLLARIRGTGSKRVALLGHIDTVVTHDAHRALQRQDDRLVGSGAVDMKGGVVLALGVLDALAARPETFAEIALLLVTDEEWRVGGLDHASRLADFDACFCFEAGQAGPGGEEGVIVKRKAAGTLRVRAEGRSSHSGSAPDRGRNALLALAHAAERVAGCHDPDGDKQLSAVPTIMNSGEAFNVVPASGELFCDLRAESQAAFETVIASVTLPLSVNVELAVAHDPRQRTWTLSTRNLNLQVLGPLEPRMGSDGCGVGYNICAPNSVFQVAHFDGRVKAIHVEMNDRTRRFLRVHHWNVA